MIAESVTWGRHSCLPRVSHSCPPEVLVSLLPTTVAKQNARQTRMSAPRALASTIKTPKIRHFPRQLSVAAAVATVTSTHTHPTGTETAPSLELRDGCRST